jgi:regulator of protease activity HflC (stomatin/prohibitin superfamily)
MNPPLARNNMRRFLESPFVIHAGTILIIVLCFALGSALERPEIGWFFAGAALFAVGFLLRLTRTGALLVALLYIMLFVAWLSASPWILVVLPLAVLFGTLIGAFAISDVLERSDTAPFFYILRRYVGLLLKAQTIYPPNDGVADGDERIIGPRMVTVRPDAAALVIASDQTSRVWGPGRHETRGLEFVFKIYSLRPIRKKYHFGSVLTSDNIPLTVDVSIIYGIEVREAARVWAAQLRGSDRGNVGRITAFSPQWEAAMQDVAERNLRRSVGLNNLNSMLAVGVQQGVGRQTTTLTSNDTVGWGICIYDLQIVSVQPDINVIEASLRAWLTGINNRTLAARELARGNAWAGAFAAIARAYDLAIGSPLPVEVFNRELVRRLFEEAALDPSTRALIQSELGQMLTRRDVDP